MRALLIVFSLSGAMGWLLRLVCIWMSQNRTRAACSVVSHIARRLRLAAYVNAIPCGQDVNERCVGYVQN